MSETIKFSDLSNTEAVQEEVKPKSGLGSVEIDVAGPGKMLCKTIVMSLDQRGLIKLAFKEGGKLPVVLQGRFTSLDDVKTSLTVWQDREAKHYKLDEDVSHPHAGGGQSVSELVDNAAQDNPPAFSEPLDEALVESEDIIDTLDLISDEESEDEVFISVASE